METMTKERLIDTIKRRAYDDGARHMQVHGVVLTHDEADALGEEAMDWLRHRLSLAMETDAEMVRFSPTSRS